MINQTTFLSDISKKPVLLYDQGMLSSDFYATPFALTDVLTEYAGEHQQAIVHFWQLEHAMILGMKDTRVPHLKKGIASLAKHYYQPLIRNSGGLGVIADEGILNLSLILPKPTTEKLSIDEAYTIMWHWVQEAFATGEHTINAHEISTSYCPGAFDLSIHGLKFAGIAQRRIKNGIAIMIYLSVTGNQKKRGEIVRDFYQESLGAQFGTNGFPAVEPTVMANLETLLAQSLTIDSVKEQLLNTLLIQLDGVIDDQAIPALSQTPAVQAALKQQLKKMEQRNELLHEL